MASSGGDARRLLDDEALRLVVEKAARDARERVLEKERADLHAAYMAARAARPTPRRQAEEELEFPVLGAIPEDTEAKSRDRERLVTLENPDSTCTARFAEPGAGQPEVEDFHVSTASEHHVRGFEIAMYDASLVCGLEPDGDLTRNAEDFVMGERASA